MPKQRKHCTLNCCALQTGAQAYEGVHRDSPQTVGVHGGKLFKGCTMAAVMKTYSVPSEEWYSKRLFKKHVKYVANLYKGSCKHTTLTPCNKIYILCHKSAYASRMKETI